MTTGRPLPSANRRGEAGDGGAVVWDGAAWKHRLGRHWCRAGRQGHAPGLSWSRRVPGWPRGRTRAALLCSKVLFLDLKSLGSGGAGSRLAPSGCPSVPNGCIPRACHPAPHPDAAAQGQASRASGCGGRGGPPGPAGCGEGAGLHALGPHLRCPSLCGRPPASPSLCPGRVALRGHPHTPPRHGRGPRTPSRPAHQPPGSLAPCPQHARCGHLTPEIQRPRGWGRGLCPGHLSGPGKRTSP